MSERKVLIKARKLKKYFDVAKNTKLKAVEDATFMIYEGEKFGVVGESGCGKSTLGRLILQLHSQTSGSCVYFGKSIQEINPRYLQKEIGKLKDYQTKAKELYQKSLKYDQKVKDLNAKRDELDIEISANDARLYDKLSKEIDKARYTSKEYKKNASRSLREGSRIVGSLILSGDLDKVTELFFKAEDEIKMAHDLLIKCNALRDRCHEIELKLHESETIDDKIKALEAKKDKSDIEKFQLDDYLKIKKSINNLDVDALISESQKLSGEIDALEKEILKHRENEMAYRKEAFSYRDKNVLDITERCQDETYRRKLDANYETGINLSKLTRSEMRSIRKDMQMIFQDPAASLDPREAVGKAIEETFKINTKMPHKVRKEKTMQLLEKVGLKREHYYSYPHSLSGGQKQRVGIARAIALDPSFIVLDEAVSALDVSVQAQILELLDELIKEKHMTYFFITHDLGVVKHFCDRIMVMYLGNVCELAPAKELFKKRLHPYTESLLESVPRLTLLKDRKGQEKVLEGEVPSAIHPPKGCPFHTRCQKCMDICRQKRPKYIEAEKDHFVACHLYGEKK